MPTFAQPFWLFVALASLPGMIVLALWSERRRKLRIARFIDEGPLVGRLVQTDSARRTWAAALRIAALLCLLAALARPQMGFTVEMQKARGIDILIALDVSRSMLAEDVKPNRLERAKLAVYDLLRQIEGDRVGLIAFAGDAFAQCPLTLDYDAFRQTLESLDTAAISRQGTDIAAAIREAKATFEKNANYKFLILITDGEDLEAQGIQEARAAAEAGWRIFTVGVGSPEGELILLQGSHGGRDVLRGADGKPVRSRLDEPTLRSIAEATDGFYLNLVQTGSLEHILREGLADVPPEEREGRLQRLPIERYQWPLAAAFVLLCLELLLKSMRWGIRAQSAMGWVLLLLGWGGTTGESRAADLFQAQKLFDQGRYAEAVAEYEALLAKDRNARYVYNLGLAQYHAGDFAGAANSFRQLLQHPDLSLQRNAYYNLACAQWAQAQSLRESDPQQSIRNWMMACANLQRACQLDPENAEVFEQYHQLYREFFRQVAEIQSSVAPEGAGVVEGAGRYYMGSQVTLRAIPNDGYRFVSWEGDPVENKEQEEITFAVTKNLRLVALFFKTWELKVEVYPQAAGQVGQPGIYEEGSDAPLTAHPVEGFAFDYWSGEGIAAGYQAETTIRMDQDRTATAVFRRTLKLVVRPNDPAGGKTTGSGDYASGEWVTITAVPNEGYVFEGWVGDGVADPQAPTTTVLATGEEQDVFAVFRNPQKEQQQEQKEQEQKQKKEEQQQQQGEQSQAGRPQQNGQQQTDLDGQKQDSAEAQSEQGSQEQKAAAPGQEEEQTGEPQSMVAQQEKKDGEKVDQDTVRRFAGAMTRQEALQLLEQVRQQEKKLPIALPEDVKKRKPTEGRDW